MSKKEYVNLKLIIIDPEYCDFLRKYDERVMMNRDGKEIRPYVGVLFKVNNLNYFAPLSSPKLKHKKMRDTIDFTKINDGIYGAINFNNMIPVIDTVFEFVDLKHKPSTKKEKQYLELLKNQIEWLNENRESILKKSKRLYLLREKKLLYPNVLKRCCNFKLLEEKISKYI